MLVKIRCSECNREGSFYFAGSSYQGSYFPQCGHHLTIIVEDGQIKSCKPLKLIHESIRRKVSETPILQDNWTSVVKVLMIIGIAPLAVVGVSFLFRGSFIALVTFYLGFVILSIIGFAMLSISGIRLIGIAFGESAKCGLLCFFLPFYVFYYAFTRRIYSLQTLLINVLWLCLFLFTLFYSFALRYASP